MAWMAAEPVVAVAAAAVAVEAAVVVWVAVDSPQYHQQQVHSSRG